MFKNKKKNIEGFVDLNQARLEKNENPRPNVKSNQKVSNIQKNTSSKTDKTKELPTINKSNKVKSVKNINDSLNKGFIPRDKNGKIIVSRRALIFGAIGVGAIAAGGAGVKFVGDKVTSTNNDNTLNVPKSNVTSSTSLTETGQGCFHITNDITLPYGTLAWANSSNVIACLVPTDVAKPLSKVQLINTDSGKITTVLDQAVGLKSGFEIYDVRANDYGIIWTEVNILQGEWRIYASKFNGGFNIDPIMIDTSDSQWETPTICVSNNYVYWQVLPDINGPKAELLSSLKKQNLQNLNKLEESFSGNCNTNEQIQDNQNTVFTSMGRMSTPVNIYDKGVIITPRKKSNNIIYQLTYLNNNDQIIDSIELPQSMKPMDAGYGQTGFNFAFDAIYNYGEGISNLGTYTPMEKAANNYENSKWLNFSRVPSASPAWCNDYFIVRSTMSICIVDLKNNSYFVLDRPNASDEYGDYLASCGNCNKIVTYANIFDQPISGEDKKYCSLRIWELD